MKFTEYKRTNLGELIIAAEDYYNNHSDNRVIVCFERGEDCGCRWFLNKQKTGHWRTFLDDPYVIKSVKKMGKTMEEFIAEKEAEEKPDPSIIGGFQRIYPAHDDFPADYGNYSIKNLTEAFITHFLDAAKDWVIFGQTPLWFVTLEDYKEWKDSDYGKNYDPIKHLRNLSVRWGYMTEEQWKQDINEWKKGQNQHYYTVPDDPSMSWKY
ncbi:MAG: hypothetical protein J6I84_03805 [Bacilli bacterium]|nr:hypothetical protein [Bacilli bacterium]